MKMRFLLALMLSMMLMLTASAQTPAQSAAEKNGYAAFKSYLEAPEIKADCLSKVQLILHNPYVHGELQMRGLDRPDLQSEIDIGSISINAINGGNLINFDFPFYFVTDADSVMAYFEWNNAWKKIALEGVDIQSAVAKRDPAEILAFVKSAVLVNDTDGQQIIRAAFDCQKLAEAIKEVKPAVEDKKPKDVHSEAFQKSLNEALLQTGTIDGTFTINKMTNQPVMVEFDLSNLIGNIMKAMTTQEGASTYHKEGMEILSALAPATRLQLIMLYDYSGQFDAKEFELPKKVRKAEDLTPMLKAMAKIGSIKTQ